MRAADLITQEIPPLRPSDTVGRALEWMEEFKVVHLPVVQGRRLLGVVKDATLVDLNDIDLQVDKAAEDFDLSYVNTEQHIYDVMKLFSERSLTVVPVIDPAGDYVGCVTEHSALKVLSEMTNIGELGSVIVLEMNANDYSLQQIAGIVEGNDAKILNLSSRTLPDPKRIEVTVKVDREDISGILQTFERYEYLVRSIYQSKGSKTDLNDRYEELMRFINM